MPKLTCLCGFVHNLSPIPDEGYHTIRERDRVDDWDDLWGLLYECPECGRLAWTRDRFVTVRFYTPEREVLSPDEPE